MKKYRFTSIKGITLISLVISIIVLLILAGVTIATLTGDNGLLTKARQAKNASDQANLEEEVQLALVENEADKYFSSNSSIEDKLKAIFEKSYGTGNITVAKSGKNYKIIVKDTKIRYRVRYDGKVEKYEEMDPTSVYGKIEGNTLKLRATQPNNDTNYKSCSNSAAIVSNLNGTKKSIEYIEIEEPIAPTTTSMMFEGLTNLTEIINIKNLHTENVTNMYAMFWNCKKLKSIDLSTFDLSKTTEIGCLFLSCTSLESVNLTGFDVSNVQSMKGMFSGCSSLKSIDLSGFNTENTTDMNSYSGLFYGCSSLTSLDLTGLNTSKVTNMNNMFSGCSSLTIINLTGFDTSNVTSMGGMFAGCSSLENINLKGFNTSKVQNMSNMFKGCNSIKNLDLSNFNTSNVNNMETMFWGCKVIDLNLSNWNTGKLTNMYAMFIECTNLKHLDISNFDTSLVTNMSRIFESTPSDIKIKANTATANKIIDNSNLTNSNFE